MYHYTISLIGSLVLYIQCALDFYHSGNHCSGFTCGCHINNRVLHYIGYWHLRMLINTVLSKHDEILLIALCINVIL